MANNANLDWFSPGQSKHPVFGKVVAISTPRCPLPLPAARSRCPLPAARCPAPPHLQLTSPAKVIEGMEIATKISKVKTVRDNPVEPIKMLKITVEGLEEVKEEM